MGSNEFLKALAEGTLDACDQINKETIARVEEAEALLYVAGFEFKNGCYLKSDQRKAYLAKLDAIHAEAMRLMGRK